MRNYYIIRNGASTGPFSLEQLKYNAVLPETKVWYEGLPDWVEARTLAELSELFAPIPMVYTPTVKKEGTDWGFWVIMTVIVLGIGIGFWYFTRSGDNVIVLPKTEKQRLEEQKVYYRNNWKSFVECGHVGGNQMVLGGFSDIKIQAKNKMPYTINQLTVVVEYTLKNGQKRLSTPKYFININPNQLSDIKDVEDQSKGIALKTKIIAIVSGEIGLNYAEN